MGYVVAAILVLLLVAGFVTFLVMQATRRSSPATSDTSDDTPGIGRDPSPLGDTTQHTEDSARSAGTGAPSSDLPQRSVHEDPPEGRFKRDPVGGEGEGEPAIESDDRRV
jgi:hypothetical protein